MSTNVFFANKQSLTRLLRSDTMGTDRCRTKITKYGRCLLQRVFVNINLITDVADVEAASVKVYFERNAAGDSCGNN